MSGGVPEGVCEGETVAIEDGCSGIGLVLDVVKPPNVAVVSLVVVLELVGVRDEATTADEDPAVTVEEVPATDAAVVACGVPVTVAPVGV